MAAAVNPNANPFLGGGKFVSSPPTAGPVGSIASAGNNGSLLGNVSAGTPMLARNSRGSNVTIPYARVVLHAGGRTALPTATLPAPTGTPATLGKPGGDLMVETERLYSGRITFILGRRGKSYENAGIDNLLGMEVENTLATQLVNSRTQQMLHQFATGGVDQHTMQRLCSFEYLERYFFHVIRNKKIAIDGDLFPDGKMPAKYRPATAEIQASKLGNVGKDVIEKIYKVEQNATTVNAKLAEDLGKIAGKGWGIKFNDSGPFLRGKTLESTTSKFRRGEIKDSLGLGDCAAFEYFEILLKNTGAMDWTPDGIVLSKLDSGGSDQLADDEIDARQGQLYNVTIGGPAITSSWTEDTKMEVLPLDKLFVVLVGDVWFSKTEGDAVFAMKPEEYQTEKDRATSGNTPPTGESPSGTIFNIRVMRMTSSQMVNYSATDRCGLKVGTDCGEYILGGWCIGTVLDSAAARAMPDGMSLVGSVKRARTSHAANLCVDVQWWSADSMYKKFADRSIKEGKGVLRTRYDAERRALAQEDMPALKRDAPAGTGAAGAGAAGAGAAGAGAAGAGTGP